jgi:hypothetical protein
MEDWRYEGLRRDIDRLEEQLRKAEDRTYQVQLWQRLLPLRVIEAIFWLIAAAFIIVSIAASLAHSS